MRYLVLIIIVLQYSGALAQVAPTIQWEKCIGGSSTDISHEIKATPDGGYIIAGFTHSTDAGFVGYRAFGDVLVVKTDAAGNTQWSKCYGGSSVDAALKISLTNDGGYILTGTTLSNDGNVTGYHGGGIQDIWVAKLDAAGNLQWQKAWGGTGQDIGQHVIQTSDAGYLVAGSSGSINGDLTGLYSGESEAWLIKLDAAGSLQWQKRFGGTLGESFTLCVQTSDGGYVFAAVTNSMNGDINCTAITPPKIWVVKLNAAGTIQWQQCSRTATFPVNALSATADGGFIICGATIGASGSRDAWIWKTNAMGITDWEKIIGGSGIDEAMSVEQLTDGSFIVAGSTNSPEIDICNIKGNYDLWLIKLRNNGQEEWQRRFGGSLSERPEGYVAPVRALATPDGGFIVAGNTNSTDGDINNNHGINDIWLVKFTAPGIPILPTITIVADKTVVCSGASVNFVATVTNGGTDPSYQWKINGVNTGSNNDSVTIRILNSGDIITCFFTSNSNCVTVNTANSNTVAIIVDPALNPRNFLSPDTIICRFDRFQLKPVRSYANYLWNNDSGDSSIQIKQAGVYWLEVTDTSACIGRDTIIVGMKECLTGFFMPTAFSPNNDGLNDVLKPVFANKSVEKYRLTIYDRWGHMVFETVDPSRGWSGRKNGIAPDSNVYVWVCSYQFAGEAEKMEKGTVVLVK